MTIIRSAIFLFLLALASGLTPSDTSVPHFLQRFATHSAFCLYRCPNFYEFICFVEFGCWAEIRDFVVLWIAPLAMAVLIGTCCTCGNWSFVCWFRYFGLVVGVRLFLWVVKNKGDKIKQYLREREQRKEREAREQERGEKAATASQENNGNE
jgi:heme exporter protein D